MLLGRWIFTELGKGPVHLDRAEPTELQEAHMAASVLAQGLGTASQLKYLVAEFWAMEGKLPCENRQLGFNDSFEDPVLKGVEVTDCGELTITYKAQAGLDGGRMVLQAIEAKGLTGPALQWECWTPDFSGIEQFMPQCRYRNRPS